MMEALDKLMFGRTVIIISHEFKNIRAVNRIIVFRRGVIVEEGTHEALAARKGEYNRLLRRQGLEVTV